MHSTLGRDLNAALVARHAITLSDYEVLLRLARAEDGRLRRVDLAEQVLLTPSGITRLLEGLERAGLVCRGECAEDRRVVYAQLTPEGEERLRAVEATHLDDVRSVFEAHLSAAEVETLASLLSRLPGGEADGSDCSAA